MQKQNPIDDLFRKGLWNYRVPPSDERRAAFMREAGKSTNRSRIFWWMIGVVCLLLVGAGITMVVRDDHSLTRARDERDDNNTSLQSKSAKSATKAIIQTKPVETPLAVVIKPVNTPLETAEKPIEKSKEVTENPGDPNITPSLSSRIPDPSSRNPNPAPRDSQPGSRNPDPASRDSQPASRNPHPESRDSSITTITSSRSSRDHVNSGLPKKWNISASVYYTPEWMFNTLNGDKFVNNMGVEGTFHFGRYSVRTGVGLSITTGSNEMVAKTNPYLGSYNALDSIVFKWGDHYNLIPTYYTSAENVYDTALKYNYSYNKKRYTYLQVPLILGYDFWQNNWLSLGVRAGAVMSLLMKTENLSGIYDPGKDRIIMINNVSPDRIQLNWQAVGGINAAFRLSRRFSFEAEPEVRYYFNSVYESSVLTKKPWSAGVRTAIIVTF